MAWEWSHSPEAYEYAREQVQAMDKEKLKVIYAEWRMHEHDEWEDSVYFAHLKEAESLDELYEFIWDKMSEQALCGAGGFEAWCCPYGCHMVPFSEEN